MINIRLPLAASKSFVYVLLGLGLALVAGGAWLFNEHHALAQVTTRLEAMPPLWLTVAGGCSGV